MMKKDSNLPSLDRLQAKIDALKNAKKLEVKPNTDMAKAVRLLTDLAAGVIMGVGSGYFIDTWMDKTPVFMIIGLFIGMAAGINNMIRSAKLIDKKFNDENENSNI